MGAPGAPVPVFSAVPAPSGIARIASDRFPLDHPHGSLRLGAALRAREVETRALAREPRPFPGFERTVFLDLETTGLAGGTGTITFLVGVGRFVDDSFLLQQFFLHDPADERAMLERLDGALRGVEAVVTFNGKSFDLPLLETRFALNRMRCPLEDPFHLDLLAPSRRLWACVIGECSLGSIERRVIGLDRGFDVPGWMIPGIYASYLRTGDEAEIHLVARHNRLDILSLAVLLAKASACLAVAAPPLSRNAHESVGAASIYESIGLCDEALRLYEEALDLGDAREPVRSRALWGTLRLSKRRRNWDGCLHRARVLAGAETPDPEAWIEIAKHHEHRSRELDLALEAALQALGLLDRAQHIPSGRRERLRSELNHRINRLRRRLGS